MAEEFRPLTDDDLKALVTAFPDIAKSAGVGAGRGVIDVAGAIGSAGDYLNRGIDTGLRAVGLQPAPLGPALDEATLQKLAERFTGPFYQPQTPAGELAETGGRIASSTAIAGPILKPFGAATRGHVDEIGRTIGKIRDLYR
jgi:hypothetical protein